LLWWVCLVVGFVVAVVLIGGNYGSVCLLDSNMEAKKGLDGKPIFLSLFFFSFLLYKMLKDINLSVYTHTHFTVDSHNKIIILLFTT
jgi:hypothetical protein